MVDTGFTVADEDVERFAACYRPGTAGEPLLVVEDRPDASSRYTQPRTYLYGAGGMVSTASDYMRFCKMPRAFVSASSGRRLACPASRPLQPAAAFSRPPAAASRLALAAQESRCGRGGGASGRLGAPAGGTGVRWLVEKAVYFSYTPRMGELLWG